MGNKIQLLKDTEDFMRDVKVKLVGATGIVSQPITFERVNDLLHRLEGAIILAERERKRKL